MGLTVSRDSSYLHFVTCWNPNGSTGHVELVLVSGVDQNTGASVVCTARASAETFTIPDYMLFSLPNGTGTFFRFQLGDEQPASSAAFSAAGLNIGFIQSFIDGTHFGGFTVGD